MSDKTVRQLAEVVGMPLERLLVQLKDAGLKASAADDVISENEKVTLLEYLRKRHGKADTLNSGTPKRVTLKRRTVSELKQSQGHGQVTKTISIEVRKKKTYVKRGDVENQNEQNDQIEAQEALLKQQQKIAAAELENKAQEEQRVRAEEQRQKEIQDKNIVEQEKLDKERLAVEKTRTEETRIKEKKALEQAQIETKEKTGTNKVQNSEQKKTFANVGKTTQLKGVDIRKKRTKKKGRSKTRNVIQVDTKHKFEKPVTPVIKEVAIPENIIVSDLAQKMSIKAAEVIKQLMKLGIMATINQSVDQETAMILVEELGHKGIIQTEEKLEQEMIDKLVQDDRETQPRAPIVTIMGHVDHGKTSLLDYIRESQVAAGEAGGITQHIGAYQVKTDHGTVTFLDTPGHAAFTAMRARGAQVTDIVIIVVAADDGVMPQTKEAVEHARAAGVPIIIAINKIDKAEADPKRVMQELATIEVVPEEWGGDIQFLQLSAKTGQGVAELVEALILQAEILELKAPDQGQASGFVLESRLDKGRGAVATVLVQKGTLQKGDIIICGHEYGRVRAMFDENSKPVKHAGPSSPVEVLGLSGTPDAGEEFLIVENDKKARELATRREDKSRLHKHAAQQATKLEEVFSRMEAGETASLNLLIKTDVQGSMEALRESLLKLSHEEVTVKVVYAGVGGINEGDANLALASDAVIIGFNVRADATARKLIQEKEIDLHYYSVIYQAIDEVKKSISGMLKPEIREKIVGTAEVRDIFRSPKFGLIAGSMVIDGFVKRNLPIRVLRDNIVIYEGQLESLRRFKDDITEVNTGMECGIGVKNYNDVKVGDQIEVFERTEIAREL